ncbi:MAG: GNAT family N-acetyltransferase [Anaerolineales bacterium]
MSEPINLSFRPLTSGLWIDFEHLFGPRGACGGCWCMFWKLRGKAFDENTGEPARQMQKSEVESGTVPGLLVFDEDEATGWIAVEPRSAYPKLAHSRILKPVDDADVWSVTCFFVAKQSRRQGLTVELLKASVEYVRAQGGKIVEGYPVETKKDMPAPFIYTGTAAAFQKAGFVEVARRSETRPIMRYTIGD